MGPSRKISACRQRCRIPVAARRVATATVTAMVTVIPGVGREEGLVSGNARARTAQAGQSFGEFAVLMAAVSLAVVAMSTYAQRAIRANMGNVEDELNARLKEDSEATTGPKQDEPEFRDRPDAGIDPIMRKEQDFDFIDGI